MTNAVRVATVEDLDRIMAVLMLAHEENGFVSASPQKILVDLWAALNQDGGVAGVIDTEENGIEGVIVLRIGKIWYSDDGVLDEKLLFVPRKFRAAKGGRARHLCDFSKKMADELGIPLVIGVLSNERTEGKMRLYERIFGKPAGAFFLYGASTLRHASIESEEV